MAPAVASAEAAPCAEVDNLSPRLSAA